MKKTYTVDAVCDAIDKELVWRKKELKLFKDSIPTTSNEKQKALLRASIPILYAHWEGFVKTSCEIFLNFVSNRNLKYSQLKPQFIAIALGGKLGVAETKKIEKRTESIKFIIDNLNNPINFNAKGNIDTKSNLRFDVFKDICYTLCLNISSFEYKHANIDDLVDNRNNIAHGNYIKITYKMFTDFYDDTIELLNLVQTELQNSVALESYKL